MKGISAAISSLKMRLAFMIMRHETRLQEARLWKADHKAGKKLCWDGTCHAVIDVSDNPYIMDMHSHGLLDEIGTELQAVLFKGYIYIDETRMMMVQIAHLILNQKLDTESSEPFTLPDWKDCKFKFYKTKDSMGDDIVRIIECDMKGRFPEEEGCDEPFNLQYSNFYGK